MECGGTSLLVRVYDFDDRLEVLKGRVAFDAAKVQVTERTAG